MIEEELLNRLEILSNLIAFQITKDQNLVDSVWILRQCGMSNTQIAQLLGISINAVTAHYANKKKQMGKKSKSIKA
ncbi:MAG: hypothetical protein CVT49_16265 [candidate division Zixibacteria bacterium HGW-Zixibacteria-1]|nr:MAG: hypothetical protein CVT49_16265 [candidate division Zixibacteria bacterium HGW-Zixibacteria-1]